MEGKREGGRKEKWREEGKKDGWELTGKNGDWGYPNTSVLGLLYPKCKT